jgi:hypothetical protein
VPQLKHVAQKLDALRQKMQDDANDFGQAWFQYRSAPVTYLPAKYQATFKLSRSKLMNAQKAMAVTFEKMKAMRREADSLVTVAEKATMKAGIREGVTPPGGRPIGDAQRIAHDGAVVIARTLADLKQPKGSKPRPDNISTSVTSIGSLLTGKQFSAQSLVAAQGSLANAEAAFGAMQTKLASMQKQYANLKKALRSNELSDSRVKAELANAADDIKEAQTEVKTAEANIRKARATFGKYQTAWKAAQKKK